MDLECRRCSPGQPWPYLTMLLFIFILSLKMSRIFGSMHNLVYGDKLSLLATIQPMPKVFSKFPIFGHLLAIFRSKLTPKLPFSLNHGDFFLVRSRTDLRLKVWCRNLHFLVADIGLRPRPQYEASFQNWGLCTKAWRILVKDFWRNASPMGLPACLYVRLSVHYPWAFFFESMYSRVYV